MNDQLTNYMILYQKGDEQAFEKLYEHLKPSLYSFIFRYSRHEQMSIDIVQDTFLLIQSKKHLYNHEKSKVKTYIFQIAYHIMINKLNRRKKWLQLVPFLVPTEDNGINETDKIAIKDAISQLPEQHRAVILLKYYDDMTNDEIANVLNIPTGTVKSRLHNGIEKLRILMGVEESEGRKSV